jgi:hypothetical protein
VLAIILPQKFNRDPSHFNLIYFLAVVPEYIFIILSRKKLFYSVHDRFLIAMTDISLGLVEQAVVLYDEYQN